MPIYSYKCRACHNEFDLYQKISDRDLPTESPCESCKTPDSIQKQVTATSGFLTDVSTNGGHKTPAEFKDFLKELKKNSGKASTIEV